MYTTRRRPIGFGVEFPDTPTTPTIGPLVSFQPAVAPSSGSTMFSSNVPSSGGGSPDSSGPLVAPSSDSSATLDKIASWWNGQTLALRVSIATGGTLFLLGIAYLLSRKHSQPRTAVANKRRRRRRR